jgi:hypothetical protein
LLTSEFGLVCCSCNMNTIMRSKSQFDTGNWSEVNGLPGQQDMLNFLEFLAESDPQRCFTRRQLMDEVAKEFEIPATAQEADGPKSSTPGYYTRLTYLISDAVQGVRRAEGNQFLKRVAFSVYQHVTGNGDVSLEMKEYLAKRTKRVAKVSKRLVDEARVSVKILKSLQPPHGPYDAERCMVELGGKVWSDDVLEVAINMEFAL